MFGKDIEFETIQFTKQVKDLAKDFNCGNEVLNEYLQKTACDDTQAVTFVIRDTKNNNIMCYYSISCSGFIVELAQKQYMIYPAVEIKMFAIDEKYQHIPISEDSDEGNLSDILFASVICRINEFTENQCGADKIILYSVEQAKTFYERNGFKCFEDYMLQSTSRFLDGCIPMYYSL